MKANPNKSALSKIIENKKFCISLLVIAIVYDLFYSIVLAFVLKENPMSFTMSMIGRATIPGRFPTLFVFFGIITNLAFLLNINYAYHRENFLEKKIGKVGYTCAFLGVFFLTLCTLIPSIEKEEVVDFKTGLQMAGHWSGALLFAVFFAASILIYLFVYRKRYKGYLVAFISLVVLLIILAILLLIFNKNGVIEILPLVLVMVLMILVNLGVFPLHEGQKNGGVEDSANKETHLDIGNEQ